MSDLPVTDPEIGAVSDSVFRLKPIPDQTYVQDSDAPPDDETDTGNRAHAEWARFVIESIAQTNAALFAKYWRPGYDAARNSTLADLALHSIPTPIGYWRGQGDPNEDVSGSGASEEMITNTIGANSHPTFSVVNTNPLVIAARGICAGYWCHDTSKHFNSGDVPAYKLGTGDASWAMFMSYSRDQNSSVDSTLLECGLHNLTSETGAFDRLPWRIYLGADGHVASERNDRVLIYEHYDAGDTKITVPAAWDDFLVAHHVTLPMAKEWHIGVTRTDDGGSMTIRFYVNGALVSTVAGVTTVGTPGSSGSLRVHIGSKHSSASNALAGTVRNVGIWDSVLTAAQMKALHDHGVGLLPDA